ncbi:hypothetical protein Gpo141_00002774 [Globisporangium polare]
MATPSDASSALKACIDGSRTLLRELEKAGERPPEELTAVQDLLECIDRNAEQIALALASSRRRKNSDGVVAVAGLLREQDQFFQQIVDLYGKLSHRPPFSAKTINTTAP